MILRLRFSDAAARAVDALVWGWWTYRSFRDNPLDEAMVRRAYQALIEVPATEPYPREGHHA